MRRWKQPLLIIAIAAVYSAGVLFYLSRMPALFAVLYFLASAPFEQDSSFQQCLHGLKDMRLEPADAPEGQRLTDQGISFVLDTQEPIVEAVNYEYNSTYRIGEDKMILIQTFEPYEESADPNASLGGYAAPNSKNIYKDERARMLFEKATGKSPDTEYVCEEAAWDATIWDFSLLDNNKNVGVLILLIMKCVGSSPDTRRYRFDNGNAIGILTRYEKTTSLVFFSPEDLNTRHYISLAGKFTEPELDTILRTLTLDEPHAKQEVDIP